jgi:hypothetical protein
VERRKKGGEEEEGCGGMNDVGDGVGGGGR